MYIRFLKNVNLDGIAYTTASGTKSVTDEVGNALIAAGSAVEDKPEGQMLEAGLSYDASGNTVLVGPDGFIHLLNAYAGMVVCKPASYIEIPNATPTVMEFDDVLHDPLGVYNATTNKFDIPADVVMLDWEVCVELANTASTYGNAIGNRNVILPPVLGMGTCTHTYVSATGASAGGGLIRWSGFGVEWDAIVAGSELDVKFSQNSGSTIRIGDSSGAGAAQTYFKMRMYRAVV